MIYESKQLRSLSTMIDEPKFLVHPYIPAKSKVVLLHGPGGVGKSGLLWSLANALESGVSFLGLPVQSCKTLVISTDMNVYELHMRWGDIFKADFSMEICQPFDCLDRGFSKSAVFKECTDFAKQNKVELVLIDTLGKVHFGDPTKPETVTNVYHQLTSWFPDTTIIVNAHNRKSQRDIDGSEIITDDDFLGSRKWVDDCVVQLHMRKVNGSEFKSRVYNPKNQVAQKAEPIDVYIDTHGQVELWDDIRANLVISQWRNIMTDSHPIIAYMDTYHVSRRTASRVKAMYDSRKNITCATPK